MNLEGVDEFKELKIVYTRHQLDLMKKYENTYITWIKEYVYENYTTDMNDEYTTILNKVLKQDYLGFLKRSGREEFKVNDNQFYFDVKINLMEKYNGIRKGKRTYVGGHIEINYQLLVSELNLNE